MADCVVVGGGPGGAAAAITLARAGRSVVLVDKAGFPRDKCCGDGLTTGALRRLEALGLRPDAVPSWHVVDGMWVRSVSGRVAHFPFPKAQGMYGATAHRHDLDAALLDVARAVGVKVHDGHALAGASAIDGGVELDVEGIGRIAAPYVIGADGMWSPLRKALGATGDGYLGDWHAFRQYFSDVTGPAASQLWVWFEPGMLPGYVWSFPLPGGRANVGFGIRRRPGRPTKVMKDQWARVLDLPHVRTALGPDARPEAPHKAWPIPAGVLSVPLSAAAGRALFVGDAARAADPMTGEGIGQALETGMLAGQAILAGGDVAGRYERAVRRGLALDNRVAGFLSRHGVAHRKGVRFAVCAADLTPWTRRSFVRFLFEDFPRALPATPHRWPEHRRVRGGAYRA